MSQIRICQYCGNKYVVEDSKMLSVNSTCCMCHDKSRKRRELAGLLSITIILLSGCTMLSQQPMQDIPLSYLQFIDRCQKFNGGSYDKCHQSWIDVNAIGSQAPPQPQQQPAYNYTNYYTPQSYNAAPKEDWFEAEIRHQQQQNALSDIEWAIRWNGLQEQARENLRRMRD